MECLSLTVDDPDSVRACYKEVARRVGSNGLDYLFNNAGRSAFSPLRSTSLIPSQTALSLSSLVT